jgi:DNA-binding CsgD family transcriptional regulator
LIEEIYSACNEPSRWRHVLLLLRDRFEVSDVALLSFNPEQGAHTFGPITATDSTVNVTDRVAARPWFADESACMKPGRVVRLDNLLDRDEFRRTSLCQNWLQRRELAFGLLLVVERLGQEVTCLVLLRSCFMPAFNSRETATLGALHGHLAQAIRLTVQLEAFQRQADSGLEAFNQFGLGMIVIQGRDFTCNKVAQTILDDNDGLQLVCGRLKTSRQDQSEALEALIDDTKRQRKRGGELAIMRPSGNRPLTVVVRPIGYRDSVFRDGQSDVAVFLADPDHHRVPTIGLLRQVFGLTSTEAQVASKLASGKAPDAIAEELNVSIGTARNHLKRILAKTETSRQAELVALIGRMPVG